LEVNGTIKGNIPAASAYSETAQTTTTRSSWIKSTAVQMTVPVTGKYLVQVNGRVFPLAAADNWYKIRAYVYEPAAAAHEAGEPDSFETPGAAASGHARSTTPAAPA